MIMLKSHLEMVMTEEVTASVGREEGAGADVVDG